METINISTKQLFSSIEPQAIIPDYTLRRRLIQTPTFPPQYSGRRTVSVYPH